MAKLLSAGFFIGPLLFGLLFIAPLFAQVAQRFDLNLPLNIAPITAGLILGGVLGLIATVRGRWL